MKKLITFGVLFFCSFGICLQASQLISEDDLWTYDPAKDKEFEAIIKSLIALDNKEKELVSFESEVVNALEIVYRYNKDNYVYSENTDNSNYIKSIQSIYAESRENIKKMEANPPSVVEMLNEFRNGCKK